MNIPAYTAPTLCLGRTYDARNTTAGIDIFPSDIPTKKMNVNQFTFKYKVVRNISDVKDLLDISGELSLKVKAGLVKVEGSGKYLSDTTTKAGTTELLAVLKCITITETMDGSAKVKDEAASGRQKRGLGTHYVRGVTYGGEMVASLSIKSSSSSEKVDIQGRAEGEISVQAANIGLKAELQKLTSTCKDTADISIKYYATDLPDKLPTTLDDLVKLIEEFPSRLKDINDGKGIQLQFELLPIDAAAGIHTADLTYQHALPTATEDLLEQCFDDLRSAEALVKIYEEGGEDDDDDDILDFHEEINKVMRKFKDAISVMNSSEGEKQVDVCLEAYRRALDGRDIPGKYCRKWRKILRTKTMQPESSKTVTPLANIKKPATPTTSIMAYQSSPQFGKKPLTVVLLGKTGNGKSATGNEIIGAMEEHFGVSDSAQSVTDKCERGSATVNGRQITVIDTPGILDTNVVKKMSGLRSWLPAYRDEQERILTELAKMYTMAPNGFDAIILVAKFGARFTAEDAEALKLLKAFLGVESEGHMILILTRGDEAERNAKRKKVLPVDKYVKEWIGGMPGWVQDFIHRIGDRIVLFNNLLDVDADSEAYYRQLNRLIQTIDKMTNGKPFVNSKTQEVMNARIEEALNATGYARDLETLKKKLEEIDTNLEDPNISATERKELQEARGEIQKEVAEIERKEEEKRQEIEAAVTQKVSTKLKEEGGCYPGSAMFIDKHGGKRRMDSLQTGEEVQVINNNEVRTEPVIAFIHRQQEVVEEFIKITTMKRNILKITEDHLMFVEKRGQETAIPARDVKVGDTVYVRGKQGVEKDAVQSISTVYEKGVYAPVTLNGTILVNDVHTSCYFDVLSHEWSQRAMGVARAVYYVSPWMLQWLSGVGQKDGFPGWCRLAHKMLTLLD